MPAAAALKKRSEPPVDGDRIGLRNAIAQWKDAQAAVEHHRAVIARAKETVENAVVDRDKCCDEIAKADEQDLKRATSSLKNEAAAKAASPLAGETARAAFQVAKNSVDLAQRALAQLEAELAPLELAMAVARNAVVVARNVLLAPTAAAVLERIKVRRIEQLKDRVLLAMLISDNGAPEFPNDASAFFPAREAEVARRQAFGEVRAEAARDAADLAVVPPVHDIEEAELVMDSQMQWTYQLAALLEDPDAKLPEQV